MSLSNSQVPSVLLKSFAAIGALSLSFAGLSLFAEYASDSARRRLGRIELAGRVVVVTGAGTGIGKSITEEAFRRGAHVVLCGRREGPLRAVAGELEKWAEKTKRPLSGSSSTKTKMCFLPEVTIVGDCDVTNEDDVHRLHRAVREIGKPVALVVLNAGRSCCGEFDDSAETLQNAREMIELNYMANVRLAQLFLPLLQEGRGGFLAVSSLSGLFPTFRGNAYCAAKHALNGFLDTVRVEQLANGVSATISCPGYVLTDCHSSQLNNFNAPPPERNRAKFMTADYVAARSLDAAVKRERRIVLPWAANVPYWLRSIFPSLVESVIKRGVIASYTDDGTKTLKELAASS